MKFHILGVFENIYFYFFLLKFIANLQFTPKRAMSKCVESVRHEWRSHSTMALLLNP